MSEVRNGKADSGDEFVEGVGEDAGGTGSFESWDEVAFLFFVEDDFDGYPGFVGELGDGGGFFGGEEGDDFGEFVGGAIHLEADFGSGVDGALEKHGDVFHLLAFGGVLPSGLGGDEAGGGGEDGVEDTEVV